jgi:signal peptidase I
VDTVIAIVIALMLWFGATIVLNTSTPVSGVVSCSMLPNLERGDFIVVQGADINAYEISMTQSELEALNGPVTVFADGMEYLVPMPVYSYCNCNPVDPLCQKFDQNPEAVIEKTGPFTYHYTTCEFDYENNDMTGYGKCLEYVEFKGQKYYANLSHDTIVYMAPPGDLYSYVGDIVHRAFFKIDVGGEKYYLTKGDNNPIMDLQVVGCSNPEIVNHPVPEENVKGKVIARIPYLGYLKLLISGYWEEDSQCGWTIDYTTVG